MSRHDSNLLTRRQLLAVGAATAATAGSASACHASAQRDKATAVVTPPAGKRLLISCKLTMIAPRAGGKPLVDRLNRAAQAGFDGVDFDEAGDFTPQQVREAVCQSGVFVHNAINHAHWTDRLTSPVAEVRAKGRANIEHCIRVSHAAGGSGVLIVVGKDTDGPADKINDRCRDEIKKLLPLAASLGQ